MKQEKLETIEINDYLDYTGNEVDEIIKGFLNDIKLRDDINYAGYEKKEWIKMTLERFIPNSRGESRIIFPTEEDRGTARKLCIEALQEQKELFDKVHVFLFPCFDDFVKEKMNGVTGFCSGEKVILILINFEGEWNKGIKETVLHELAHSVSKFYKGGEFSIGEGMIFDGLAEHYRESVMKDRKSPLATAITKEKADKIFEELKDKLDSKNLEDYTEIFFGTGKYPNWSGYTIGYYLIEDYLKKQKKIDWNKLLRKNPKEILKEYR